MMKCHRAERWIQFQHEGQEIRLQGVIRVQQDQLKEISAEQLIKWEKGNDVWATAILNLIVMTPSVEVPPAVQ